MKTDFIGGNKKAGAKYELNPGLIHQSDLRINHAVKNCVVCNNVIRKEYLIGPSCTIHICPVGRYTDIQCSRL